MSEGGAERERLAVFGGSFDPPHVAHVMAVAYVLAVAEVDSVVVMPTWVHPLQKAVRSDFEHRFAMCELAFADLRRVSVSRLEAELGGQSYTLRTLEELTRRRPGASLRLVIGADILGEVDRWHAFERVAALAPPLIVGRSGYDSHHWEILPVELPPVSSSEIRGRLAAGEDASGLVPRRTLAYARAHGLYAPAGTP